MNDRKRQNMNHTELDQALNTESQQRMRELVRSLPDESLSLEWRSHLNESLRAVAAKPKRSSFARMWQPAVGLVATASLAAVVTVRLMEPEPKPVVVNSNLEAVFVQSHTETSRLQDVTGAGLGTFELHETTSRHADADLWEEPEPGTL